MCTAFGDRGGWGRGSTHPAGQKINMVARWFDHHTVAEGACRDLLRAVQQASRNTSFSMIFSVWYGYDYCTQLRHLLTRWYDKVV